MSLTKKKTEMKIEIPDPEKIQQVVRTQEALRRERPKRSQSFIFRLIKLVCVLIVIILILLYLIFKFGIGGGDGSFLPGGKGITPIGKPNNETGTAEIKTTIDQPDTKSPPEESNNNNNDNNAVEEIPLRFEMIISFENDPANSDNVKEFACNIERIDTSKRGMNPKNQKSIVCENMSDFEFAIEKEIRDWRLAFDLIDVKLSESAVKVVPVLNVKMNPFPGEGVFRKIESTARSIDPKISIMRSED
jgi:hypothetical protein